eukprot:5847031-Ditylum_brightwellii.AAC.1
MNKSLVARDWDWVCAPFQCECCWVQNLLQWEVEESSQQDKRLYMYIMRVKLDIFWARAKSAVAGMVTNLHKGIRLAHDLGIPHHIHPGNHGP